MQESKKVIVFRYRNGTIDYHDTVRDRKGNLYNLVALRTLLLALKLGITAKRRFRKTTKYYFHLPEQGI